MTVEAKIISFMRVSRGISQSEAAGMCRVSTAAIGHFEHGRMDITTARLEQFLAAYGYTPGEFEEDRAGKPIPVVSVKDECIGLLDRIDETKLRAVHAVLTSFVS